MYTCIYTVYLNPDVELKSNWFRITHCIILALVDFQLCNIILVYEFRSGIKKLKLQ